MSLSPGVYGGRQGSYAPSSTNNNNNNNRQASQSLGGHYLDDDENLGAHRQYGDLPKSVMAALTTRDPQESFLRSTMSQFEVFPADIQNRLQIPRPRTTFSAPLDDDESLDNNNNKRNNNSSKNVHPAEYLAQSDMWRTGDAGMYDGGRAGSGSASPTRGGGGPSSPLQEAVLLTSETHDMLPLEPGTDGHSAGSQLFDRAVENFRRTQAAAAIAAAAHHNQFLHNNPYLSNMNTSGGGASQSRSASTVLMGGGGGNNNNNNNFLLQQTPGRSVMSSALSPTPMGGNRFSVTRASVSQYHHHQSSSTPKNAYTVNASPDHLSKPEPDYSILDTPSFLKDWGAQLSTLPRGAAPHLRIPKLPTDMLLDGQTVGAPPASTSWDANAALNEDVMFEESRQMPELYLADPTSSAAGDLTGFFASVTPFRSQPGIMIAMEGTPEYKRLLEEKDQADKKKAEDANKPAEAPASPPAGKKMPPGKSPAKVMPGKKGPPGSPQGKSPPPKPAAKKSVVVIPKGPLSCDYLAAPSHSTASQESLQQFLYQAFVEELSRKGQPIPTFKIKIEPTRTILKPVKHNAFNTGEFWDPFFQFGWFQKAKDPQQVIETAKVTAAGTHPKTREPMFSDAFGNIAPGLHMMHPMRRWLVEYFQDKGTQRNDPIVKNIDKWLMDNIKDLFGFEKRLLDKLGHPRTIKPLSAIYDVQYPEEAGITFTPTKYETVDEMSADNIVVGTGPIIEVPRPVVPEPEEEKSGGDKKDKKGKKDKKDDKSKDKDDGKSKDKDKEKDKKEKKEKKDKK